MSELKEAWKQTGAELGGAFKELGKALIKSGKLGVETAVDWAEGGSSQTENGSQQPSQQSAADEIRKLAELRDQGIITEEEFEAKKKQILGL